MKRINRLHRTRHANQSNAQQAVAIAETNVVFRLIQLIWAGLLLGTAIAGMVGHPLGPYLVFGAAAVYALLLIQDARNWLILVPTLLPVLDQTVLTGRIFMTESDLMLLLTLCICYARRAIHPARLSVPDMRPDRALSPTLIVVSLLLLSSYLISTLMNLPSWTTLNQQLAAYHSDWNGLRVAKGFFFPLLFVPLLHAELKADAGTTLKRFGYGMALGLAAVCLYAVYERLAFVSLTDFASDYRITASFWEMNVGGAALDGFLILSIPVAAWLCLKTDAPKEVALGMFLLMAASYALFVTFTRTTYVGAAILALIILIAHASQRRRAMGKTGRISSGRKILYLFAAAGLIFAMTKVFQNGGYRTLAALIAIVLLAHPALAMARLKNIPQTMDRLKVVGLVLILAAMTSVADLAHSKGSYLMFAGLAAASVITLWRHTAGQRSDGLIIGLWFGLLFAAGVIASHWGGPLALINYAAVACALGLCALLLWNRPEPLWNWTAPASCGLLMFCVLSGLGVVVLSNFQMGERFSQTSHNLDERTQHWETSLNLLKTPTDWLLGRGVGSFPKSYWLGAPERMVPGTMAFRNLNGAPFVSLTSNHTDMGSAEMLRLIQRVAPKKITHPEFKPLTVMVKTRASQNVKLSFEVCGRHLIYPDDCVGDDLQVAAQDNAQEGQWQTLTLTLRHGHLNHGPWYAPKTYYFAMAIGSTTKTADIAEVQLIGADGKNILKNSDFAAGTDHWFVTSDRNHLPWHIKNLFLNMLFDQGLFGLTSFILFVLAAMVRTYRQRRTWPEAPYFLAAISGFLLLGLFDSLVDVPRIAILFYLLCWIMLLHPLAPVTTKPINTG
jgi:hypothetical protein